MTERDRGVDRVQQEFRELTMPRTVGNWSRRAIRRFSATVPQVSIVSVDWHSRPKAQIHKKKKITKVCFIEN